MFKASQPGAAILAPYRRALAAAGLFSLFLNLLVLTLPLFSLQLFDRVLSSHSIETLVMLTVIAGFALLTLAALDVVRTRVLARVGARLDADLSGPALRAGITAAAGGAPQTAQGLRDVAELRGFLNSPAITALFDAPWAPVFVLIIFLFHPLLGTVSLAGAVALFMVAIVNERLTQRPMQAVQASSASALARVEAGVRHADAVRAMGMLPAVIDRWRRDNGQTVCHALVAADRAALIGAVAKFIRFALQVVIMAAAAWLVIRREATAGAMIASSVLMGRALAPVEVAITGWRSLIHARAAHRRLGALLAQAGSARAPMRLPRPQGRLTVEGLHFIPPGAERPSLRGISFALQPGQALGILGPSGAGKSTLARLLVGVWAPNHGKVRLDGADLQAWDPDDLGRHIGYLPQDVQLFGGTVRENIARLDPDAAPEAVVAAATMAGVHDMILRLPQGYDTDIGEGGMRLSGGQRQRIGLARALFGRPRLLVLDEPNANLDPPSEEALLRAIAAAKDDGTTVVIIAHRPVMVSLADRLLVLRDGTVEMVGPRSEILPRITRQAIHPAPAAATGR